MSSRPSLWPLVLILVWLVGMYALTVAAYGTLTRPHPADVAIVLGSAVHAGQPEAPLASRLEAARRAWADTLVKRVFVSGATHGQGYDESAVMRTWLLAHGVPDSIIVRDSLGMTTGDTGVNAAAWMRGHGATTALVVTQWFHVARTTLACRQAGIEVSGAAVAARHEWRDVTPFARELVALPVYAVRSLPRMFGR